MIKKLLSINAILLMVWTTILAVPAKPGYTLFTQTDGTSISIKCVGDEFYHCFTTTDNLVVAQGTNENWYYKTAKGISNVLAHDAAGRSANEIAFISNQAEALQPKSQMSENARQLIRKVSGLRKMAQVPNTGKIRIPILLVDYNDVKMKHTKAEFDQMYSADAKSVYQYFYDQSNGKLQLQIDLYGIYTLSGTRATYGANDSTTNNDVGVGAMVGEAVDLAQKEGEITWSNYDNDGNEECDVVIVVYAGVGESQAYNTHPESIWPCQWNLSSAKYYGDGTGGRSYNTIYINKFAVFCELNGSSDDGTALDGIGTFCHEFSHCLGLPDFYETTYQSGYYGMGSWSLLDYGCYNDDGNTPCGYTAYEKNFMGWMDYITPTQNTKYTLSAMNQKSAATDQAVKIVSDLNSNEYYILENKQKQGWDQYIPSSGLLISHVSYVASRWSANTVNNQSVQLMTIAPADGILSNSSENGDCFGNGNSEFTDRSSPAATLYLTSAGVISGSAGYLGKPVTNISNNEDGTVSFMYMNGIETATPVMQAANDDYIGSHQFRAEWTHSSDEADVESYTLQINEKVSSKLLESHSFTGYSAHGSGSSLTDCSSVSSDYLPSGWNASSPFFIGTGYALIGNTITTCAYDMTGFDKITVVVKGRYFNSAFKPGTLKVSTSAGSATCSFTSSTAVTDTLVLEASNDGIITFTGTKYPMIYNIDIYGGDITVNSATAAQKIVAENSDSTTRTITGITNKYVVVKDLGYNGSYYYKVKAIYKNGAESYWSNIETVTLHEGVVKTGSLKDILNNVQVGDKCTIESEGMAGVASFTDENGNHFLIMKDEDAAASDFVEIPTDIESYAIEGKDQKNYVQNNWLMVKTDDADTYVGKSIGSVSGTVTNASNLALDATGIDAGDEATSPVNTYCPINFMGETRVTNGSNATSKGTYFFMTPKRNEYARIAYAVYGGNNQFFVPKCENGINANDFTGGFQVNWELNGGKMPSLVEGETYAFNAIIKKEAPTQSSERRKIAACGGDVSNIYTVYPVNFTANLATAVDEVNVKKTAVNTIYYNMMGAESATPFAGVNIAVTRFSDGSSKTKKILK